MLAHTCTHAFTRARALTHNAYSTYQDTKSLSTSQIKRSNNLETEVGADGAALRRFQTVVDSVVVDCHLNDGVASRE